MKISIERDLFQSQLAAFAYQLRRFGDKPEDQLIANKIYQNMTVLQSPPQGALDHGLQDFVNTEECEHDIRARARYLGNYATDYSDLVLRCDQECTDQEFQCGAESEIYRLGDIVIKIRIGQLECSSLSESVDHSIVAGMIAEGKPGFEQLRAASYDDLALVSDFVRGKCLNSLSATRRNRVLRKHRLELSQLAVGAAMLGIAGDLHFGNIMYHKSDGFTIIDYSESSCSAQEALASAFEQSTDKELLRWAADQALAIQS
jgi:hypothetical protein